MENSIIWLAKVIFAHLLSDFIFQRSSWVTDRNGNKIKSKYLYIHILITGATALVLVGPKYWGVVLIITISHYLIDLGKAYLKTNFTTFLLDQFLHLAVIILCWMSLYNLTPSFANVSQFYHGSKFWIYAAGTFFLTYPTSIIVYQATKQWSSHASTGLLNAGKYIGIIERLIICLLVYQGMYEAIGLLIAGKSILRYKQANEEKQTEYLLIGTLISMSISILVGMLLKYMAAINIL